MRRLLRLVFLLVAALAALLFPAPGGADTQVSRSAAVAAHNYDSHRVPEAVSDTAAERGPPAAFDLDHPFDDAGLQSHRASAGPNQPTPVTTIAYTTRGPLGLSAVAADSTRDQVRQSDMRPQVAADTEATAGRTAAKSCLNSFTADTPVAMADGSKKSLKDVKVGDRVLATDPETGETKAEPVEQLIRHSGRHQMVLVGLADGSVLDSTDGHPIWNASRHAFVDAGQLRVGDKIETSSGRLITITALTGYTTDLIAYNLQISTIHTYYAGNTPVLVHNSCDIGNPASFAGATRSEAEQELLNSGYYNAGPTSGVGGTRYRLPNNPSDQVRIMPGNPADPNLIKQGPYIRFSVRGVKSGPYPLATP